MEPKDREILSEFATRVRSIEPRARIWAYGSRARGDAEEFSDLDVCVVLPGQLTFERRQAVSHIAWAVGFDHDRLVATVVFSDDQFERGPMSAHPLVKKILREGLAA
jgi:predicted nucleotidyltransferase